jgi:hypothetical protein
MKSEKDASEKLTRVGVAKSGGGAESFSGIVDTKWVPL